MGSYRKFIFVCNGSDCKKCGCKKLQHELKDLVKSEDHKGKYKIIKTKCMDFCKSAPVLVVNNEVLKKADLAAIKKKLA
ncbi:(2Fe-2S) ferredoxin domain-containing protein [Aquiflexum gelatinilyticum]|uniref:(2Fe-2S) ferredoxin domain-containing protein n=1 Tax=Aquiflexum gelatinilyticum TaxID=2961943 RepID=UPI00216AAA32|nr:(2Fe-2S) ferredoxin domain-containing protein [Aquiflexum gelatinilyticum]MCS4434505.1 (2Fe-2S) ferredoxin domain-containing protein [Aquiflexum gelatinilyticum]